MFAVQVPPAGGWLRRGRRDWASSIPRSLRSGGRGIGGTLIVGRDRDHVPTGMSGLARWSRVVPAHPSPKAAKDAAPAVVGMVRVLKAKGAPPAHYAENGCHLPVFPRSGFLRAHPSLEKSEGWGTHFMGWERVGHPPCDWLQRAMVTALDSSLCRSCP